jgi:hypothetical protein
MQDAHVKLNPGFPPKSGIQHEEDSSHQQAGLRDSRKKLVKSLCGAETRTLRKVDQKYLERFEMWSWRRMNNISCIRHVRNEEVLQTVKEKRNILYTMERRKDNWIGHMLRRNCLLKHVIERKIKGTIEVTGR